MTSVGLVGGAHHSGEQAVGVGGVTPVLLPSASGIDWARGNPSVTASGQHVVSGRIRREGCSGRCLTAEQKGNVDFQD